jgi:pyrroloquinoline quinone (PQQ) biosynthesis protein C
MNAFERFREETDFMWRMAMGCWSTLMLVKGRMDKESVAMVTLQMFHYVKHTVPVCKHGLSRLPADPQHDALRALLEYFVEDEAGHDELALRDLARLGYDPERCRRTLPLPTTFNLAAANRMGVDELGPYWLLGESFATERVGAEISAAIHEAYAASPEMDQGIAFYRVHGVSDADHASRTEACLRRYVEQPEHYPALLLGFLTSLRNLMLLGMELQHYRLYPAPFQLG